MEKKEVLDFLKKKKFKSKIKIKNQVTAMFYKVSDESNSETECKRPRTAVSKHAMENDEHEKRAKTFGIEEFVYAEGDENTAGNYVDEDENICGNDDDAEKEQVEDPDDADDDENGECDDNNTEEEQSQEATDVDDDDVDNNEEPNIEIHHQADEIAMLRQWVVKNNIPHTHVDKLLDILRVRLLPSLPKCTKTLLSTSTADYKIKPLDDADGTIGEYVYCGIKNGLTQCIDPNVHTSDVIQLLINIDGVRIFKSSAREFWPILGRVFFHPMIYNPFTIAVYSGNSKPKILSDYLQEFITEVNLLQTEGFVLENRTFKIIIKAFVCDTPARSFLKATLGHTGKNCCERCCVIGENSNGTIVFRSTECVRRTDESFRAFIDPDHHTGVTPLILIDPPIDLIKCFVLDFMHLCCLGVMKRLLEYWTNNKSAKMSQWSKTELTRRLLSVRKCVPSEFQRKPRELKNLPKWKATEYMFFLLYIGPIVLKGLLSDEQYNHFLLFHVACRLLCSRNNPPASINHAKHYFKRFVSMAENIYGDSFTVINVHNLIHVCDDVHNMDSNMLDISAYSFENYLGHIKKLLHGTHRVLAQYCRRMHEIASCTNLKARIPSELEFKQKNGLISKVTYNGLQLSTVFPNNMIMIKTKVILKIIDIFLEEERLYVKGQEIEVIKLVYKYPIDSNTTNMWEIKTKQLDKVITAPVSDIKCKILNLHLHFDPQSSEDRSFAICYLHQT